MKRIAKFISLCVAVLIMAACNNQKQEPTQGTGQEDGVNKLDGTQYQHSDTAAPGSPQSIPDDYPASEPDGTPGK